MSDKHSASTAYINHVCKQRHQQHIHQQKQRAVLSSAAMAYWLSVALTIVLTHILEPTASCSCRTKHPPSLSLCVAAATNTVTVCILLLLLCCLHCHLRTQLQGLRDKCAAAAKCPNYVNIAAGTPTAVAYLTNCCRSCCCRFCCCCCCCCCVAGLSSRACVTSLLLPPSAQTMSTSQLRPRPSAARPGGEQRSSQSSSRCAYACEARGVTGWGDAFTVWAWIRVNGSVCRSSSGGAGGSSRSKVAGASALARPGGEQLSSQSSSRCVCASEVKGDYRL